jgi:hypothetical protein
MFGLHRKDDVVLRQFRDGWWPQISSLSNLLSVSSRFLVSRLNSSTLIKISRGLPLWVIVIGPCRALAMMSPDFRERSDVE